MIADLLQGKAEVIEKVMKQVEPELKQALLELVQQLKTKSNVQLYSERLQSQKVKDKINQKRHEKDRLKEELGSAYESSEESNYDDFDNKGQDDDSSNTQNNAEQLINQENGGIELDQLQLQQQNSECLKKNEEDQNGISLPVAERSVQNLNNSIFFLQNSDGIQQEGALETERQSSSIKNKYYKGNEIQEENEEREQEEQEREVEPEFRLKQKHKVIMKNNRFNPVRFLARKLKEIIGKPLPEEDSFLEQQDTQQLEANFLEQIKSDDNVEIQKGEEQQMQQQQTEQETK